ncbi:porin [Burkholderia cepacia]|uniref:porin n=1 Tax=Burkholderia cepacia TaxID=292 RepID=UPI001CF46A3A|nr:porin [Burkholderia cepacia]MCA8030989.1 porin [Burkholderia cepacia]
MKIRITTGLLAASICGAANAQSGLTLYGIVDEFVQVVNTGSGYTPAMGSSGQWASRFGMKGTEDIGGGNSVQFVLENGFAPTTGALATAGTLFNRQAWVGIATAWGQFRAGRQNSPLFIDEARMDAFGASTQASGLDNMTMFSPRTSNTISYQSPDLAGLRGGVFIGLGDQGGLRGTGASYQADLTFDKGPFSAFVAAQALRNTAGAPNDWTIMSGLSYAVGKAKVYGAYTREKWSDLAIDSSTYGVSVGYNINPFNYVALGWAQLTDFTSSGNGARQLSGMYLYSLSKRTSVYAAVSFLQNRGHAEYKLAGAGNAGMPLAYPGADARGGQVGLVHRF